MITTTYNFTSGTGFVYDITQISFVSSMAQLLLGDNSGETYVPALASSTYDHNLVAYTGGMLEQKDQRPATATFYAAWASQLNANWSGAGNGSLVVTPFNGASIDGTGLDLTGSTNKHVSWVGTNNTDSLQTLTIEFQVTPNYTGAPVDDQLFIDVTQNPGGSTNNEITIDHYTDGHIYAQLSDNTGNQVIELFAGFNPTAGQTYTIIFQADGNAGTSQLFIDGSEVSSATDSPFTRTGSIPYAFVGAYHNDQPSNSNFSIKNFAFYSSVVTPSSPVLSPTIYVQATADLPEFTYAGVGAVQEYAGFVTTDFGGVAYILNGQYWNGSAWVMSNGSYAQANAGSVVNANIAALTAVNTLQIDAILSPASGSTQAGLSAISVTYTGQTYPTSGPSIGPNSALTMDSLSAFTDVESASGSDAVGYYLVIGSTPMWWNGAAWATSNMSFAQTNPASVINANASSLPISLGASVTPFAVLHSATGSTTPTLASLTLTYDFFGPQPTPPNTCDVFGYILDENEMPIVGATVAVTNPTTFFNGNVAIAQGVRTVKTDIDGYFSMTLVETASVTVPAPALLMFSVTYTQANVGAGFTPTTFSWGSAVIPNQPSANITTLTFQ